MSVYEDLPDLGSLDDNDGGKIRSMIGVRSSHEGEIADRMIAEGIEYARAKILGQDVIIKVVQLGPNPDLNVFQGETPETKEDLDRGIWKLMSEVRLNILRTVDPKKWEEENRRLNFPNLGGGAVESAKRPTKTGPEPAGTIVKRNADVGPTAPNHPLTNLFNQISPKPHAMTQHSKSEFGCMQSTLQIQGTRFITDLHHELLGLAQGGTDGGRITNQGKDLKCEYYGISLQTIKSFLAAFGAIPYDHTIKFLRATVRIELNQHNEFKKFYIKFERD